MKTKVKLDKRKSVLSFVFKKDGGGSYKQRDEATANGVEIPEHRFMNNKPSVSVTSVTRSEAIDIMRYYNTNNRKLNPSWVNAYAAEFLAGDWLLTGDALKFADGNCSVPYHILDGQHRLAGFILACETRDKEQGTTCPKFETVVVSGMDAETQTKMDRNLKRTISALFEFSDNTAVNSLAFRLARNWMKWDGITEVANVVSDRDIAKAFELYGSAINEAAGKFSRGINKTKNIGVFLACAKYIYYNPEMGEKFANHLLSGENLTKGSPILALRNYVGGSHNATSGGIAYYKKSMKKAFYAIEKWHNGETLKKLVEYRVAVHALPWESLLSDSEEKTSK
jgi:hypothetical protein